MLLVRSYGPTLALASGHSALITNTNAWCDIHGVASQGSISVSGMSGAWAASPNVVPSIPQALGGPQFAHQVAFATLG